MNKKPFTLDIVLTMMTSITTKDMTYSNLSALSEHVTGVRHVSKYQLLDTADRCRDQLKCLFPSLKKLDMSLLKSALEIKEEDRRQTAITAWVEGEKERLSLPCVFEVEGAY